MKVSHCLMVAVVCALGALPQDPVKRPQAPDDRPSLPPVQNPVLTEIARGDLFQQFAPRGPLEGFYELESATNPELTLVQERGNLVIGRRHISIHLDLVSETDEPLLHSAFRSYRLLEDRLLMTSIIGFSVDGSRTISVEDPGFPREVRYSLAGTRLDIELPDGSQLRFRRLE